MTQRGPFGKIPTGKPYRTGKTPSQQTTEDSDLLTRWHAVLTPAQRRAARAAAWSYAVELVAYLFIGFMAGAAIGAAVWASLR
ncbi:MAG TPA: hypothetical protein VJ840_18650 [Gemmatimonadaceae bacterium]|nr:hypothetical protein [Gemmatimonadaceae bacterium]